MYTDDFSNENPFEFQFSFDGISSLTSNTNMSKVST